MNRFSGVPDKLDDPMPTRLILHQPHICFVPLKLSSVEGVADFEVGPVEQVAPIKDGPLDVLRRPLVHERILVGAEELYILHILLLPVVVVEVGGIPHSFYIEISKKL